MRFARLRFGSSLIARRRIIPSVFRLSVLAACVLTLATGLWAAGGGTNGDATDLTLRTLPVPSHWITAMVRGSHGTWWIGTEGKGLFCWRPGQPANAVLTHFSRPQGAPANVYALACDHRGRIWAGSLNHGVCVYNGHAWREYGASPDFGLSTGRNANRGKAGPLGQRIFGLAVSPLDGAVWIATDMGLAVYHSQTHRWRYVTTGNGLACNDLSCVAFAPNGDVYVGTQCHGILAATAADHYAPWRRIWTKTASVRFSHGAGLPDNLINCLLIVPRKRGAKRTYSVYAGTDSGLAIGRKNGSVWRYIRGRNYVEKAKLLWRRLPAFSVPSSNKLAHLLSSDYVTALAADRNGLIWVGHRATGVDIYSATSGRVASPGRGLPWTSGYVASLAVRRNGGLLIGGYESHLYMYGSLRGAEPVSHVATTGAVRFPAGAATPTGKQLQSIIRAVRAGQGVAPPAAFLDDDWRTQGDWLGHYGVNFAQLCAAVNLDEKFEGGLAGRIIREHSPHTGPLGDFDSYIAWMHSRLTRTLYYPDANQRIEGEWNDQGGAYNRLFQGPDMWLKVKVPRGLYQLSFYFHNKDGESGVNDLRDYVAMIYPGGRTPGYTWIHDRPLAVGRVMQFWGGMYCTFVLRGPGVYQVRLKRNYGFWMAVQGMFLDRISGPKYFAGYTNLDGLPIRDYRPPAFVPSPAISKTTAWRLWHLLNSAKSYSLADIPWQRQGRLLAYRRALAKAFPATLLSRWRWKLKLWNAADKQAFNRAMAELAARK